MGRHADLQVPAVVFLRDHGGVLEPVDVALGIPSNANTEVTAQVSNPTR